jgi:hypothetical protein
MARLTRRGARRAFLDWSGPADPAIDLGVARIALPIRYWRTDCFLALFAADLDAVADLLPSRRLYPVRVTGTKAVVAEYEYRESVPEEVSGYCAGLGLMPAEGPADLRVEVAAYVALPWPKPTGLRRLWQARPDPATDKQSFRYRFGTAEGEWTGFLRAVADGYAVMLVRFEDATAKTWAFYEDLNAPKPEPAAEVK